MIRHISEYKNELPYEIKEYFENLESSNESSVDELSDDISEEYFEINDNCNTFNFYIFFL